MSAEQTNRERALAEAFVTLADTLIDDYDVIELLHQLTINCVELLPVDAAGLLLSDQRGNLQVVSSSTEHARLVELFELQADQGPCLDCFRTSRQVTAPDLREVSVWPAFTAHTLQAGYHAVHALPMRLREETIGALNLFGTQPGTLPPDDLRIAQALADVATIGILHERAISHHHVLTEQLQTALNSRVIIEQANGVLAERGQLDPGQAFTLMRNHARATNQRLSDLARAVVDRTTDIDALLQPNRRHTS